MPEEIDIYDANLTLLGSMERRQAHYDAQWHRTFHCWIYSDGPKPALLFQLRAPSMKNFPSKLDVSAAGHLSSGESVEDGIREVREELGIPIEIADLTFAGERVEVADQDNGQRNREYQSVYFSKQAKDLEGYTPDPGEVWGLYWIELQDALSLFTGQSSSVQSTGIEFDASSEAFVARSRTVDLESFLPRIQRYYLAAAICVERLASGNRIIAVS